MSTPVACPLYLAAFGGSTPLVTVRSGSPKIMPCMSLVGRSPTSTCARGRVTSLYPVLFHAAKYLQSNQIAVFQKACSHFIGGFANEIPMLRACM